MTRSLRLPEVSGDLRPILKWAGGKRWLADSLPNVFVGDFNRFVEPFVGSGAMFFALQPKRAWLNDVNRDLMEMYTQLKADWRPVYDLLRRYHSKHSTDFYYAMRGQIPSDRIHRAARFIYLNRTCFNGLYRVNLKGIFNVPKGTKTSVVFSDDNFEGVSSALRRTRLTNFDFSRVLHNCGEGDLVFVDPPYTINHNLNGFLKYNENLFSWTDQIRLRDAAFDAKQRGAKVIVSNANHRSIRDLYRDCGELIVAHRHSVLAADSFKRRATSELIILV